MGLTRHKFLGLPAAKPRVWIDLSSATSKRAGLAMHSPGRKVLRWAVKALGWFAWLPIEKIIRGPVKRFEELDGSEIIEKAVDDLAAKDAKIAKKMEWMALYMGNDSAKTKLTVLVCLGRAERVDRVENVGDNLGHEISAQATISTRSIRSARLKPTCVIVKLGKSPEAAEAIRNEVDVLKKLEGTQLCSQVPVVIGGVGSDRAWTWSVQSVLPKGSSPVRMQKEHYDFLEALKEAGLSHGDFAPWNCSIVDGKLYVWDWEDAGSWVDGKDESWFKGQVKKLLGIDA